MERLTSKEEVRQTIGSARRDGKTIALVPTMGALHQGHLSLARAACARADIVVVSIFVNPTQFGVGEDLDAYPRDLARDIDLLGGEGVDLVFTPNPEAMYLADGPVVTVDAGTLGSELEGAVRPTHFRGVATVVAKLLNIVQPDLLFLGEKDFQQLLVVQRMVRDLDFPVSVVGVPTAREVDGLALSSRNAYLGPEERAVAPVLYRALSEARRKAERGQADVATLERTLAATLACEPSIEVDYVAIRDAATLAPVETLIDGVPARALVAARIGGARLIDNAPIELGEIAPEWQKAEVKGPPPVVLPR
jgi:pantoate--beta-alanine ligase